MKNTSAVQIEERTRWMAGRMGMRQSERARANNERATLALVHAYGDIECRKCQDTGYTGYTPIRNLMGFLAWKLAGVPEAEIPFCDCNAGQEWRVWYREGLIETRQQQAARCFEDARIPVKFQGLGFDTLPEGHTKGKEIALAAARMFAERGWVRPSEAVQYGPLREQDHLLCASSQRKPGLLFLGKPGVGKTGILSVAFRRRLARGVAGIWIELYQFFAAVQGTYGKPDEDGDERVRALQRASLLFLDDVGDPDKLIRNSYGQVTGVAAETDDKRRLLWEVLDYRHANDLPILATGNLDRSEFEQQWGLRLAARLWECCWVVPVMGDDLRKIEQEEPNASTSTD